jgi:hypothetical protein
MTKIETQRRIKTDYGTRKIPKPKPEVTKTKTRSDLPHFLGYPFFRHLQHLVVDDIPLLRAAQKMMPKDCTQIWRQETKGQGRRIGVRARVIEVMS